MLAFYMDDSADAGRKTVFSVSGFIADTPVWFDIERKWKQRLEQEGLGYFRAYDCKNLEGEFRIKLVDKYGLTTARVIADAVMNDLKNIVRESNALAYCLGVLMQDFRELVREREEARLLLTDDPYIAAHNQIIHAVATDACKMKHPTHVAFVYDEHSMASQLQKVGRF